MKRIVFDGILDNEEMGAVISALIARKNELMKELTNALSSNYLYNAYLEEIESIESVLGKILIER